MNHSILFHEKQQFRQWWVLLILAITNAFLLYGVIRQVLYGLPFGDKPMSDTGLLWAFGFVLLVTVVFFVTTLETQIKNDGFYFRFFPFHMKFRHLPWHRITRCYIRIYAPLREYGGWGWRIGPGGRAYNISGNKGLQLQIDGKRRLLIGTQKPERVEEVLKKLNRWKPVDPVSDE